MKAKNFREGAMVRIKPRAVECGVPAEAIGMVGTLMSVWDGASGLYATVGGWRVRPEHVSLVKPDETAAQLAVYASADQPGTELGPGFYADSDGDLWVICGEPPTVTMIFDAENIRLDRIEATPLDDFTVDEFRLRYEDPEDRPDWWPLRKVADLPKPESERG